MGVGLMLLTLRFKVGLISRVLFEMIPEQGKALVWLARILGFGNGKQISAM